MKLRENLNPAEFANSVYELPNTEQVIRWYHAAAGYPTKDTWLKAIKAGFFATWPMLTVKAVRKHYPETVVTAKGHMKRTKSGVRSTKEPISEPEEITAAEKDLRAMRKKHKDVYVAIKDFNDMIYTDQTGKFPVVSSNGHKYIMFLIEVDGNYIMFEPMKSRDQDEMIRVYNIMLNRLKQNGIYPKHQLLDNEASAAYLEAIGKQGLTWELAPPSNHRRNLAERAIQTGKSHIISNLLGCDKSFPTREWHRLLRQMELTLNMLRPSNVAPKVSAYAYVYGVHDYNKMPLAPLGCAAQCFVSPEERTSFGAHSLDAWYIGTSEKHYRCYNVFIKDTRATRVTDTIMFKHKEITTPSVTHADAIVQAAKTLTDTLKGTIPTNLGETSLEELERLAALFNETAKTMSEIEATATRKHREKATASRVTVLNHHKAVTPAERAALPRVTRPTREQECEAVPTTRVDALNEASPLTENAPPQNERTTNGLPRFISQEDEDYEDTICDEPESKPSEPRYQTRQQVKQMKGNITTDMLMSVCEFTSTTFSPSQTAMRRYPLQFWCEFAGAVMDDDTGEMLEYRHLVKIPKYRERWSKAFGKEIGRLAQGYKDEVEGTNTLFFIPYDQVPEEKKKSITYARICVDFRPDKKDPYRCRITLGGNLINYPGDVGTRTADMLTVKLLLNSVISTPGAKFMSLDISNFYLMTPMEDYEYIRMDLRDFPDDIIELYNLNEIAREGRVYVEARRCIYGLPQSGILANRYLEKRLNDYGYYQSKFTPGLWHHETRDIKFVLIVDDFGVKYTNEEDVEHLKEALTAVSPETGKPMFEITTDDKGHKFCGLTLDWDYEEKKVHVSMPEYVTNALRRFQHEKPTKPQDQPYPHTPKKYGAKQQFAEPEDTSPLLTKDEKRFIQEVTGTFLFYARAVDPTMLTALSSIASEQANPTARTMEKCKQFLDYAATQGEAVITYRASDMKLAIHSDASYLSEPKARSRAGGHFFCSENVADPADNGAVLTVATIIKQVMSSAAEAELGGLFINAKKAVPIRTTLEELGHKQSNTPIQTDNSTANGLVNNEVQPKATKAMDMRFYWLKDREAQNQFRIFWRSGKLNRGDYYSKHHPPVHHKATRPTILTPWKVVEALRNKLAQAAKTVVSSAARVC